MRPGLKLLGATLIVPGLILATLGRQASYGDEPGRFGRLFRFGGGSSSTASTTPTPPPPADPSSPALLFSSSPGGSVPAPTPAASSPGAPAPRLVPQPRTSRPATESDPIVSRVSLARSSDGNQFGMFLQVFADGTVLDSEGVHRLTPGDLKPLMDALQAGELYRLKGHCGAPATDFVEQVHMVVYERSLGRLRANAFSFSGNPQGCDHAVRHLNTALDALQAKLSRPNSMAATAATAAPPPPYPTSPLPLSGTPKSLSLSPEN